MIGKSRFMLFCRIWLLTYIIMPLAQAQDGIWAIDSDSSELSYTGSHFLHDWTGRSRAVTGRLRLDISDFSKSEIELSVPLESFDSGNSNRDSNMMEVVEVWLWPEVLFTSESLRMVSWDESENGSKGTWLVEGTIGFHGETADLSVSADVFQNGDLLEARVSFPIELDWFKIKRPKLMLKSISNDIQVEGKLVFRWMDG
jgi:polyisoprenoid-binding protein YceI